MTGDGGFKVLLVEDDDAQRQTLCDILRGEGLDVLECADGAAALDLASREPVLVAVVDQRLPDMSGLQVLAGLQDSIAGLPVIIHTAYGSFDSARDALNMDAFAYIEKLGDPRALIVEVHRAIDEFLARAVWEREESLASVSVQRARAKAIRPLLTRPISKRPLHH